MINDNQIDEIHIWDQTDDQTYTIPAKLAVSSLLPEVRIGTNGDSYQCFNYGKLIQTSKEVKTDHNFEYLTQRQVSEILEVPANKISDLHRFNFLKPSSKVGTNLFYLRKDLNNAVKNTHVQTWIKSFKE